MPKPFEFIKQSHSLKEIARISPRLLARLAVLLTALLVGEAYILFNVFSQNVDQPCPNMHRGSAGGGPLRTNGHSQEATSSLQGEAVVSQEQNEEQRSLLAQQEQRLAEQDRAITGHLETIDEQSNHLAEALEDLEVQKLTVAKLEARIGELSKETEELKAKADARPKYDCNKQTFARLRDRPEVQAAIEAQIGKKGEVPNKWRQRLLPAEHPSLWQQHTFKPHGIYGYVQFSGYRSDASLFAAPGLVSKHYPKQQRLVEGCRWVGNDGQIQQGILALHLGSESFDQQYEAGILVCNLTDPTGTAGGHVVAKLDQEEFVMYRERSLEEGALKPTEPFKYGLAYCSPLLHDAMQARQVWEWIEYHRVLHNVTFFHFYDAGGIDDELQSVLRPYVEADMATIIDMREVLLFTVVSWGQKLAIADCIHRNRYTSQWVFMGDLDEYIHVRPPNTVQSLLAQYWDKVWLSHGAYNWDTTRCTNATAEDQFMIERVFHKSATFHCVDKFNKDPNLCYSGYGHRKYFLNPRKLIMANVHDPLPPRSAGHFFYGDLELWHDHYRGLSTHYGSEKFCSNPPEPEGKEGVVLDGETAALVPLIRLCPMRKKQSLGCIRKVYSMRRSMWKEAAKKGKESEKTGKLQE